MGDYNVNTLTERNKTTQLTQEFSNIILFVLLPQINKPSNKREKKIVYINNNNIYLKSNIQCI